MEDKIVYEYVSQAFLQAYVAAWRKYCDVQEGEEPVDEFLVIEEINRGNCAQISETSSSCSIVAMKDSQSILSRLILI